MPFGELHNGRTTIAPIIYTRCQAIFGIITLSVCNEMHKIIKTNEPLVNIHFSSIMLIYYHYGV